MPKKATSARVAKISGKIMRQHQEMLAECKRVRCKPEPYVLGYDLIRWSDVLAICGSDLVQREPKRKKRKSKGA